MGILVDRKEDFKALLSSVMTNGLPHIPAFIEKDAVVSFRPGELEKLMSPNRPIQFLP
jgi:hypothetical protein